MTIDREKLRKYFLILLTSIIVTTLISIIGKSIHNPIPLSTSVKYLHDTLPSVETDPDAEWFISNLTTTEKPHSTLSPNDGEEVDIRLNNPGFFLPVYFPWTDPVNNNTYLNIAHFNGIHCPYNAEYIVNSNPPTFNKYCKGNESQLGWDGYCMQTFKYVRGLIENDDPGRNVLIFNECVFVPDANLLLQFEKDFPNQDTI